ncbi:hypothetical protein V2J09_024038 [Rumex salicifolius]
MEPSQCFCFPRSPKEYKSETNIINHGPHHKQRSNSKFYIFRFSTSPPVVGLSRSILKMADAVKMLSKFKYFS